MRIKIISLILVILYTIKSTNSTSISSNDKSDIESNQNSKEQLTPLSTNQVKHGYPTSIKNELRVCLLWNRGRNENLDLKTSRYGSKGSKKVHEDSCTHQSLSYNEQVDHQSYSSEPGNDSSHQFQHLLITFSPSLKGPILQNRRMLQSCFKDCLTCSKPGKKFCLTCPSDRELVPAGSCELITPSGGDSNTTNTTTNDTNTTNSTNNTTNTSNDTNTTGSTCNNLDPQLPPEEQTILDSLNPECISQYQPPQEDGCLDCFYFEDFEVNRVGCSNDTFFRYIDWKIKTRWVSAASNTLLVELVLQDLESTLFPSFEMLSAPLSFQKSPSPRFNLTINGQVPRILFASNGVVQIEVPSSMIESSFLLQANSSLDLELNTVFKNKTHRLILVKKSQELNLTKSSDSDEFKNAGASGAAKVGKIGVFAISFVIFGSSMFSVNFAFGLIKLFQIIEIMGKFYFTPVVFSPLMKYFLALIFGISEVINVDPSFIIKHTKVKSNPWLGKLSSLKQEKYMLRSVPLSLLLYLILSIFDTVLRKVDQKFKGRFSKIALLSRCFTRVRFALFEMNLVDIIFYSAYSLTGNLKSSRFLDISNIFLALFSISDICMSFELMLNAAQNLRKRSHKGDMKMKVYSESALEGLKPASKTPFSARLINCFFVLRLCFFQVVLVGFQNSPTTCAILLIVIQSCFAGHFLFIWLRHKPFKNFMSLLEKGAIELCLVSFTVSLVLVLMERYYIWMDLVVIVFVLLSIFTQIIGTIHVCYGIIVGKRKKKRGKSTISAKIVQPKAVVREIFARSGIRKGTVNLRISRINRNELALMNPSISAISRDLNNRSMQRKESPRKISRKGTMRLRLSENQNQPKEPEIRQGQEEKSHEEKPKNRIRNLSQRLPTLLNKRFPQKQAIRGTARHLTLNFPMLTLPKQEILPDPSDRQESDIPDTQRVLLEPQEFGKRKDSML